MLTRGRLIHVGFFQEKNNSELCLGVLPRISLLLCQEHAGGTEGVLRGRLRHVGFLQEKNNSEMRLGVLPRRA